MFASLSYRTLVLGEFACPSVDNKCIPWDQTCDGDSSHCAYTRDDEQQELCGGLCPGTSYRFHCSNNICIEQKRYVMHLT